MSIWPPVTKDVLHSFPKGLRISANLYTCHIKYGFATTLVFKQIVFQPGYFEVEF